MERSDIRLSRFLSFVLRHGPESIGLTLDKNGWADIGQLVRKARATKRMITREDVLRVVADNDKSRFTLSADGRRIRAAQGHSIAIDLGLPPTEPPAVLLHGTATRFLSAIMEQGLRPKARRQIHLTTNEATAFARGKSGGNPCVIEVDAAAMREAGHLFYQADNGVWLTDEVPPAFLRTVRYSPAETAEVSAPKP